MAETATESTPVAAATSPVAATGAAAVPEPILELAPDAPLPVVKVGDLVQGKKVIAIRVPGTVKWFNVKAGYGFVARHDHEGEDIFIHQSAILKNNPAKALRSVGDGESIEFEVVQGEKGTEAVNVTGPNGTPVQGSEFATNARNTFKRSNPRGFGFRGRRRGGQFRPRGPKPNQEGGEEGSGNGEGGQDGGQDVEQLEAGIENLQVSEGEGQDGGQQDQQQQQQGGGHRGGGYRGRGGFRGRGGGFRGGFRGRGGGFRGGRGGRGGFQQQNGGGEQ